MAAALGAALVLPVAAAMAIFAGLGLGLALPFLLIGFVPALRRLMPRPGPWMARFQAVLSVPMFLTALALGWLLWRQTGAAGLAIGIGGALVLAIGLFWLGRLQAAGKSSAMLGLALLAGSGALAAFAAPATQAAPARSEGEGVPFSEAKLANLRKAGQPVFLYFTADWCLTCKVNEQTAINREEVQRAFAKNGVTVMVGDWTNADPAIGRFLEAQGRSGVPLYLFYPKGGGAARELPQVLTPAMLTALTR
jgi:thiol:disulfide interchange protein